MTPAMPWLSYLRKGIGCLLPSFHPSHLWICEKAGRNQRVAGRLQQLEKAKGEVNVLEAASGDINDEHLVKIKYYLLQ